MLSSLSTKGALIVDDCPNMRALLRDVLEEQGLNPIFEAQDGEEALKLLSKQGPQIETMFLDLMMPKLTGDGVLKKLRTVHDGDLGVILMSVHRSIETIVAENRDPRLHLVYLYKPFQFPGFLQLTKSVMQRTRESQAKLV